MWKPRGEAVSTQCCMFKGLWGQGSHRDKKASIKSWAKKYSGEYREGIPTARRAFYVGSVGYLQSV